MKEYVNREEFVKEVSDVIEIDMSVPYNQRVTETLVRLSTFLGVTFDKIVNHTDPMKIYYSVPEKLKHVDDDCIDYVDYEELFKIVKNKLIDVWTTIDDDQIGSDEFNEYRKFVSESLVFYAKIRRGEIYDDEAMEKAVNKLKDKFNEMKEYNEV